MTQTDGPELVPVDLIVRDVRAWPRRSLDHERVAEFMALYEEGGIAALPPLDLVIDREGAFLLYDGHHRIEALDQLGIDEVSVFLIELGDGQDAVQIAFERAVACSTTSAKPLTRAERRAAVVRMLEADANRADREIARIAGMSPTTVGKIRRELDSGSTTDDDLAVDDLYVAGVTAKEVARRAFRALERVRETKGLGITDRLLGDRTSERFAGVLRFESATRHSNARTSTAAGSMARSITSGGWVRYETRKDEPPSAATDEGSGETVLPTIIVLPTTPFYRWGR